MTPGSFPPPNNPTPSTLPQAPLSPPPPVAGAPFIMRPGSLVTPAQAQSSFLSQNATKGKLPTPRQLLDILRPALTTMMSEQVRAVVDVEKIWQYAQLRRNNLYMRGKQNLSLSFTSAGTGMVDYKPVINSTSMGLTDRNADQFYDIVLNWLRGDVRAFNAVLGSRSPNVQALASDPSDESVASRVRKANRVAQYIRSHCEFDNFHRELIYSLALNGTTFSYSRYVADASTYGYTSVPRYEWTEVPAGEGYFECYGCGAETPASAAQGLATPAVPLPRCIRCGRPIDPSTLITPDPIPALTIKSPLMYPNGAIELSLENASTTTIPFWVKDSLRKTPWLLHETEADRGAMCQAYTDLRTLLPNDAYPVTGSQQEVMARYTRDLFASPTGYVIARKNQRWTHSQVWYSTWCYEYLPGDKSGNFRELLYHMFPDGLRVQSANQKPFRISNERLTKQWSACKPEPSETLLGDPYFEDYIQASDTINDFLNILIECGQRSIPAIVFDPNVFNPKRIRQYANLPGEFIPALPSAASDLSKSFFKTPAAEISPVLIDFIVKYIEWVRDISGITPQIWGGGGPEPTARAAELKRNQALMRMNTVWNYVRDFEAQTHENLAFQLARFSNGRLFTTKGSPDTLDMIEVPDIEDILQGGWRYWAEEALPMTPGQRRDWYMNLFQMATANPNAMRISGLDDPSNLARWQETVGSADWRTPGLLEREGIMAILAIMSTTPPLPGGMAPPPLDPNGIQLGPPTPLPPMPNTPYPMDEITLLFSPDLLMQVTREFLNSEKGSQVRESDPQGGWQNLLAFLKSLLQAQPPPPPPPTKVNLNIAGKMEDFGPQNEGMILSHAGMSPIAPLPDMTPPPPGMMMGPGGPGGPGGPPPGSGGSAGSGGSGGPGGGPPVPPPHKTHGSKSSGGNGPLKHTEPPPPSGPGPGGLAAPPPGVGPPPNSPPPGTQSGLTAPPA